MDVVHQSGLLGPQLRRHSGPSFFKLCLSWRVRHLHGDQWGSTGVQKLARDEARWSSTPKENAAFLLWDGGCQFWRTSSPASTEGREKYASSLPHEENASVLLGCGMLLASVNLILGSAEARERHAKARHQEEHQHPPQGWGTASFGGIILALPWVLATHTMPLNATSSPLVHHMATASMTSQVKQCHGPHGNGAKCHLPYCGLPVVVQVQLVKKHWLAGK